MECADICEETLANICMKKGGRHMEEEHVKRMMDCIQVCQTAAGFMRRSSPLHTYTCAACAEVCEACAESCENLGEEMEACADICRECARACLEMSQQKHAA
jgi:hypothetical protein